MGSTRSRTPADSSAPPAAPSPSPGPCDADLSCQLEEARRLTAELARVLDGMAAQPQPQRLDELELERASELLVLLTTLRSLRLLEAPRLAPRPIDEHIEDMIDPELGLAPARTTIVAAAAQILGGYDALRLPARGRASRPGCELDDTDP